MRARVHAALTAPALVFFAPVLFWRRALYLRDNGVYFYPHKALIAATLRSGHLPQWSAQEYGGLPILADPNFNTFHPLSLLTDFLPLPWGFQLFVFAAALVAAYGAYWLGRELGFSEPGAIVCAWAFAWSGPFVSLIESGQLVAPAFVPCLFAAAVRLRRLSGRRELLLVSVMAALVLLSGTPEIAACGFLLALILSGRQGLRFLAGCALGAGLAAVQLLPTAAFVHESSRGMGFGPEAAFRLQRIPALIFPLFDGWMDAPGVSYWSFEATPWVEAVYLGAVVLLLAGLGCTKQWKVLAAALIIAVFATTPGFAAAREWLPPLRNIRFGDKLIFPLAMAVPIAAGAGFDRLGNSYKLRGAALGVALIAIACWILSRTAEPAGFSADQLECLRATALRFVPIELGLTAAALAVIASGRKLLLLPVIAVELGLPAATLIRTIPSAELVARSPLEPEVAGAGRDFRIDVQSSGLRNEDLAHIGEPDWVRSRKLFSIRHQTLYDAGAAPGLLLMRGYSGFPSGQMKDLFAKGDLNLLSVRYGIEFGSGGRSPYPSLGFKLARDHGGVRIFRNDWALPRVRLEPIGEARLARESNDDLYVLTDAPAQARLVVADTMATGWTATIDGAPAQPLPGALRVVEIPAGKHEVRWSYRAPGLLAGAVVTLVSLLLAVALSKRSRAAG
ncbi:MAG TPA: hypothetical protein VH083_16295 [Myxococcales bacterium]|nr:hypothetical protein [Myxococcales bacterium]